MRTRLTYDALIFSAVAISSTVANAAVSNRFRQRNARANVLIMVLSTRGRDEMAVDKN
jgi:hypothetical protein